MKFSEIATELRQERNLSQKELAKELGLSPAAIGFFETGKNQPKAESLKAYANFFNVSVDYLLGRDCLENFSVPVSAVNLTEDEKEVLNGFKKLSPHFQQAIKETIRIWENSEANRQK